MGEEDETRLRKMADSKGRRNTARNIGANNCRPPFWEFPEQVEPDRNGALDDSILVHETVPCLQSVESERLGDRRFDAFADGYCYFIFVLYELAVFADHIFQMGRAKTAIV